MLNRTPVAINFWRRALNRLIQIIYRRNGFNPLPVIAGSFAGLILVGSLAT